MKFLHLLFLHCISHFLLILSYLIYRFLFLSSPTYSCFSNSSFLSLRNSALALSLASYEPDNHRDLVQDPHYLDMVTEMCMKVRRDEEIDGHAEDWTV